ncbi:MAG: M12 family metallo-peptidase [Planctomycetes bacterium]|nr:M12 family metallo-peptidase [Planctomycetota bacterium]
MLIICAIVPLGDSRAETIRIENAGQVEFYYSLRQHQGEPWSKTFELEPGKVHSVTANAPVVISYWSDKPRFETLQPGLSYRVDDPRGGQLYPSTTVLRPSTTERERSAESGSGARPANLPAAKTETSDPDGVRILHLKALADLTYRQVVDDWRQRIRDTVAGASKYYEKNFRIRLVLDEIQAWEYKGLVDDVKGRIDQVLRMSPGQADLLVAFIGFGEFQKTEEEAIRTGNLGLGLPFGQHLLVTGNDDYHVNREIAVLIHELGHVFGAFHVADPRSPMQPMYEDSPIREILDRQLAMDPVSSEIIGLTREVDFHLGVSSLDPATCERIKELASHEIPDAEDHYQRDPSDPATP